jgi:hypothetical protein
VEEWSCGTGKKLLIKLFEQSVTRRVRRTTGRNLKEAMAYSRWRKVCSEVLCSFNLGNSAPLWKEVQQTTDGEMPTYPEASRGIKSPFLVFPWSPIARTVTTCHYSMYHSQSFKCRHASPLWAFMAGICRRPLLGKSNPAAMLTSNRKIL